MSPYKKFLARLIESRFFNRHIVDGIVPLMLLSASFRPVTAPKAHLTSGQLHEDEVEFHQRSEGGASQCSFKLKRIACSEDKSCEFT